MPDHARSADPAVQAQLDRLWALSPGADILGLDRITALLARLGDPHRCLPPVFHVAGTNGKGSTCAFLRAALEAAGHRVHVYTSPHLVRFNERIRIAGTLIDDAALAALLAEVLDACEFGDGDLDASFFEVTTAAAFLAFARTPADACVIEVGLGGRLDATNVVPAPVVCGIAALGIDHQAFLGDTLAQIAAEKAGIAKRGVPLVTMRYPIPIAATIARVAYRVGAPVLAEGDGWAAEETNGRLRVRDAAGELSLPLPHLPGAHQAANLALAAAMLRAQRSVTVPDGVIATAAVRATWPARLQRLRPGPLLDRLPIGTALWLDGGHNPSAGEALAAALDRVAPNAPVAAVVGVLANKDAAGFLAPFARRVGRLVAVPVGDHEHHAPAALADTARGLGVPMATTAPDLETALAALDDHPGPVLIAGSLYLAGEALALNDEHPT